MIASTDSNFGLMREHCEFNNSERRNLFECQFKLLQSIHFILLLLLQCVFGACHSINQSDKPEAITEFDLFRSNSPFYRKISPNPEIDAQSEAMMQSLVDQANEAFVVAVKKWTVPVYYADASTPRREVKLSASWAPKKAMLDVPVPDYAEADPSDDGSMVVIDQAGGCIYDFWRMRYRNGRWKAAWGNALPLDSDGIFPKGFSARGSGFELLQGLIWPHELKQGHIDHALIFSYDHTRAGGPVAPATESDGTSNEDWAIPEGALVQLDPELNLDSLGLSGYERIIAKALQEYGMYCADDGGGLQLYAVNPICVKNNPYESIWGDQTLVFLDKIPADRFRILKLPPQSTKEPKLVSNSCIQFR